MAPIRIGFIGLSATRGWARNAHFPYLDASEDFQITAICNSTLESAEKAVKVYNLPSETKAYDNFEDIAKDANVDLIVVCVKAALHYPAIVPSILAKKSIYVEWPLGCTATEAASLYALSLEHNTKLAVVGLQGRFSPVIKAIREVVDSERVGKVLSSTFNGQAHYGGSTVVKGFEYSTDLEAGAGLVNIFFGHMVDMIQLVLGELDTETTQSLLATKRKLVNVIDPVSGAVVKTDHPRTAHDTLFLHGALQSGAVMSISMRGGPAFKGCPALDWRILCEAGEIRITADGLALQMGPQGAKIEVFDYLSGEVVDVRHMDEFDGGVMEVRKEGMQDEALNMEPTKRADEVWKNIGRLYNAIAESGTLAENEAGGLVNFETAVKRQALLEKMLAGKHY